MPSEPPDIWTIGHSTHAFEPFLALLRRVGVTALADVRTAPYSRRSSHFNRDELTERLRQASVGYVFLGRELGGRPRDRAFYCDGVADYEKMATAPEFQDGLEGVIAGSRKHRIALMCAEHDPLDCHRCLLVARALAARGLRIRHILPDGETVSQPEIEDKLLQLAGQGADDLFEPRDERLTKAYRDRARRIAFADPTVITEKPVAASHRKGLACTTTYGVMAGHPRNESEVHGHDAERSSFLRSPARLLRHLRSPHRDVHKR